MISFNLRAFANVSFFLLILSNNFMKHSLLGQMGMAFFCFSVALLCIVKKHLKFSYFFLFMLLFILFNYYNTLQGIAISDEVAFSMIGSQFYSMLMLFFAYNYFVICGRKSLDIYVNAVLVTSIIMVLLNIDTLFTARLDLNSSFMSNHLSFIVSIAIYITLHDFLVNKRKNSMLKTVFFLIITLLTGSRKGIFSLIFGMVFLFYTLNNEKKIRNILIGIFSTILIYISIMNIPILYDLVGSRVEVIFNYLSSKETTEYSLRDRLKYIDIGWAYFLERPWTGYGLNNFKLLPEANGDYSHNNFIELLFSGGIIAFAIYYLNYSIAMIRSYFASKNGSSINKLMFTIILSMILIDYGYVAYHDRMRLLIWIMVVAFTRNAIKNNEVFNNTYNSKRRLNI